MQKGFQEINLHGTVSGRLAVPVIGENGNWFIGNDDTGVCAIGTDGTTPHIGENGNWFLGEEDTGVRAKGVDGAAGPKGDKGDKGDTGLQGPAGNFSQMEVIFDGIADKVGSSYQLLKPITDYRVLFVEYGVHIAGDIEWTRNHQVIVNPRPSSILCEHGSVHSVGSAMENNQTSVISIYYHFTDSKVLKVDHKMVYSGIDDARITKIYGMK